MLAIDNNPLFVCLTEKFSSLNYFPNIDSPPNPLPVIISPP